MPTRTQQADLLAAGYASHGDTKHVMLFPSTPKECFEHAAMALDLADRLQTPILLMSDLELGMNDTLSEPLEWNDSRVYDRGKVLGKDELEQIEKFGRYVDLDGDGIGYRTYPGTHPEKGAFFTRGTSRNEYAAYTEDPDVYEQNMARLSKKWETASTLVPKAEITDEGNAIGIIYFGTTAAPMPEALDLLVEEGIHIDSMRIRGFPFGAEVLEFIRKREAVFVVEQNRDGQMRQLLISEGDLNPSVLVSILYFGGLSISADTIQTQVSEYYTEQKLPRLTEVKS